MAHPLDSGSPLEDGPFAVPFNVDASLAAPEGIEGLETLSKQGRWLEVAKRCTSASFADTAPALTVVAYHVLALLKLSMHDQAAAELSKLGDLSDDAQADCTAAGDTSLVPFALRVLSAEVPWRLGRRQEGVDRLHHLLEWCARQELEAAKAGSSHLAQLWQRRHRDVLLRAVARHCQLRQFVPALSLLNRRLLASPSDAEAWVQAGLVQALLGDLAAAGGTLQHAEQLLTAGKEDAGQWQQRQAAVHRNRGLLAFLHRDYRAAAKEFAAAQAADPGDAAAASNAALSQLYCCRLGDAVRSLERVFADQPAAMLQEEGVVLNLATLYELGGSGASLAAKARMAAWVAAAAPDDFDLSCTKTQGA